MINYRNNGWCIGLLLSMIMAGSCNKKEAALIPSNKDENYLVVTDKGLDHAREQVKMILADIRNKISA